MCGIVGFINNNNLSNSTGLDFVKKSILSLNHRGPDSFGILDVDNNGNIILGHTRLSILDLTEAGSQPMSSASSNIVIAFNGEIYNHLKLREKLKNDGYSINWKSSSDTETIVELIDHYGINKTLTMLHGMFAFSVYDKSLNKLTLVRDKAGEKPLYYSVKNSTLIFSSELSVLTNYKYFQKKISLNALNSYLKLSYVPSPLSIFEDTFKIEPGTYLEFNLNNQTLEAHKSTWFSVTKKYLNNSHDQVLNYEESKNKLDEILNNAVDKQLLSDVEVGTFLSGGIDSSIISAIASSQIENNKLKTFSVSFEDQQLDESSYAKQLADYIGSDHYNVNFSDFDLSKAITDLPKIYDEPFADSSQLPTIALSEFASKQVKVCLSGDGGDEVFGGYNRYIYGNKLFKFSKKFPKSTSLLSKISTIGTNQFFLKLLSNLVYVTGINKSSMLDEKISKFIYLLSKLQNSKGEIYESILNFDSKDFMSQSGLNLRADEQADEQCLDFADFLMLSDFNNYLPDDIFTKVDRAAMHFSLETRAPLLDEEVLSFALSVPSAFKISGQSKRILRDVGSKYVPKDFFLRPKQGFSLSLEHILSTELYNLLNEARDYLLANCTDLISKDVINSAMPESADSFISPKFTWNLVVFSLWHEYYFKLK